ncbi:MAG: sulfatase-like hydrolase/transferase [Actinomycetia bacterium]|nr:sulfatase-like hydrolase/transferase [Actinomycetes bacterium]
MQRTLRTPFAALLVAALLATLLAAAPPADAAEGPSCTFTRVGASVVDLTWDEQPGWPTVRRDGKWRANAALGAVTYTDVAVPAEATYTIRYWSDGVSTDIACSEGGEPQAGCTATRVGTVVTLNWPATPGFPVVRQDGIWKASPGQGATSFIVTPAPVGASWTIRTWLGAGFVDEPCVADDQPDPGCTLTWSGSNAVLDWGDLGGFHVVRHNGSWVASPGTNSSTHTVIGAEAEGVYDVRTWSGNSSSDRVCADLRTDRVIHISIDGLRSDHVTAQLMPNLAELMAEGASTLNARTDYDLTKTLPNHTSKFTGRPVYGDWGHQVDYNADLGNTVHDEAGFYVASMFDVVHDNGDLTAYFAGKSKFDVHDRTWDGTNGAADTTGADNGQDKIDVYQRDDPSNLVSPMITLLENSPDTSLVFFHIRFPDAVGHEHGWSGPEYDAAVTEADGLLGEIVDALEADADLAHSTNLIVTSDHGGPDEGDLHDDQTNPDNYTVPFIVWGPGVNHGADLYVLNSGRRADPGVGRPDWTGTQPIRLAEVANLVTTLLGLPSVPGSVVGAGAPLHLS